MNDIFASLKKGSTTFHKILEEKGIFIPASHNLSALTPKAPHDGEPYLVFNLQNIHLHHMFLHMNLKTILMALKPRACLLIFHLLHQFILC